MPFRFKADEPVARAVIRIAREQMARAVKELSDEGMDRHEAVHQARRRFKKVRAVLRLVRFELGEAYAAENAFFRDAGRALSEVRDAEAMVETVDRLAERFADEGQEAMLSPVREALVERRQQIADEQVELGDRIAQVVKDLEAARRRAGRWPLSAGGFDALSAGLKQTYKRGRRALAGAAEDPTPENLHEWRKRVKYHWYHACLLAGVWPPVMKGYRRAVHRLANLLGQVHDLDVLRQTLLGEPERFGRRTKLRPLLKLVDGRRAELVEEAKPLGRRVFAEKPSAFCARMEGYWGAWREEGGRR